MAELYGVGRCDHKKFDEQGFQDHQDGQPKECLVMLAELAEKSGSYKLICGHLHMYDEIAAVYRMADMFDDRRAFLMRVADLIGDGWTSSSVWSST